MIENITIAEASELLTGGHYLGALEFNPSYRLSTPKRDALAVLAPPTASSFNKRLPGCLELTRLWQSDARRASGRKLSLFVREVLDWLSFDPAIPCIFSYTDPGQLGPDGKPHSGVVYQWSGFSKLGTSRVTDLWRDDQSGEVMSSPAAYRRYRTKDRAALSGLLGYTLIEKPPKILYCYPFEPLTLAEVRAQIGGRYATRH